MQENDGVARCDQQRKTEESLQMYLIKLVSYLDLGGFIDSPSADGSVSANICGVKRVCRTRGDVDALIAEARRLVRDRLDEVDFVAKPW